MLLSNLQCILRSTRILLTNLTITADSESCFPLLKMIKFILRWNKCHRNGWFPRQWSKFKKEVYKLGRSFNIETVEGNIFRKKGGEGNVIILSPSFCEIYSFRVTYALFVVPQLLPPRLRMIPEIWYLGQRSTSKFFLKCRF